jgi:GNAT superfamily N-acetyltransferase
MMEKYLGVLAGIVIGAAQLIYLLNGLKKKVTPSVLSWFGWACLMGTSLIAQVIGKGWQWSMTGILCSTVGCIVIAAVAFFSRNYSFRKVDLSFLVVGLICVAIYLWSSDPWITTVFAIIADAALGIPTIRNAVRAPGTERSAAWVLGVVSSTLALIICIHHDWIYVLFPGYLFLFNGAMAVLTRVRGRGEVGVKAEVKAEVKGRAEGGDPVLTITPADRKNIPTITQLINSAYRGDATGMGWTSEREYMEGLRATEADMERLFDRPDSDNFQCSDQTGEIVGFVSLEMRPEDIGLGLLSVLPKTQAGGVGKRILNFADGYARAAGKRGIRITVVDIRAELIAWYERRGYRVTGKTIPFPEKAGAPKVPVCLIEMRKEIGLVEGR